MRRRHHGPKLKRSLAARVLRDVRTRDDAAGKERRGGALSGVGEVNAARIERQFEGAVTVSGDRAGACEVATSHRPGCS
jgi:hypothetical protein